MDYVQIIYDGDISDEVIEEKSTLTPMFLDNSSGEVIPVNNVDDGGANSGPTVTKNKDLSNHHNATTQENRSHFVEWRARETNYLLRRYNKYIVCTGPRRKMRTKKDMWDRISRDMKNDLKVDRSPFQCENRYKTILRKWRKQTNTETNTEEQTNSVDETSASNMSTFPPIDTNESLDNGNSESMGDKKSIAEVLWEIFKKKEESRERRHKEKMELLKKLLHMDQFLN